MVHMTRRPTKASPSDSVTRASVSFPTKTYAELEKLAAAKKVSLAWVVREAAERYVADQWPLLERPDGAKSP
jgi:metal-responsive CopG/Arc/MetJ family transcriptional regulator